MRIADLPTPCLVLDRPAVARNIAAMDRAVSRHNVRLRPHLKTAKSIEVARMALVGAAAEGAITVSTLAEAEYFGAHGLTDILYAIAITPQKIEQVDKLNAAGAQLMVVTDDPATAAVIGQRRDPPRTLIEIDTGGARAGLLPDDPALLDVAAALDGALAGVMTHGGHSYFGRTAAEMAQAAEQERDGATRAAARLRAAGYDCPIVSVGSTPTALHAESLDGVTEMRAGVYMFGDLFQSEVGSLDRADVALTVLASVVGRRPAADRLPGGGVLLDAGGLALSLDRSTAAPGLVDCGYGLMLDEQGRPAFGQAVVAQVWQEHALVALDPAAGAAPLAVGDRVRVSVNHACMTAAAHDRYFVTDDGAEVAVVWHRINGW